MAIFADQLRKQLTDPILINPYGLVVFVSYSHTLDNVVVFLLSDIKFTKNFGFRIWDFGIGKKGTGLQKVKIRNRQSAVRNISNNRPVNSKILNSFLIVISLQEVTLFPK